MQLQILMADGSVKFRVAGNHSSAAKRLFVNPTRQKKFFQEIVQNQTIEWTIRPDSRGRAAVPANLGAGAMPETINFKYLNYEMCRTNLPARNTPGRLTIFQIERASTPLLTVTC